MWSYMNTEYTSLRNEINQYKTGQITLFTATASATGIMLGIFINLIKVGDVGEFNLLNAILIMLPLIVIIPSSFMFFEKAVKINRLEAYCAVYTERFMCDPGNTRNYLGYPRYKSEYLALFSRPMQGLQKTIFTHLTYSTKSNQSIFKEYFNKWLISKEKKYWVNFSYAYWGLTCTCFIVYIVYAFGSISDLSEAFFAALTEYNLYSFSAFIFVIITAYILYGRTAIKGEEYWRLIILNQIMICIFFIFLMAIKDLLSNPIIMLFIEILLAIFTAVIFVAKKRQDPTHSESNTENILTEETSVVIYLLMIVFYAAYLLISLSENILSDRAFVSIICLIIIAITLIWNFINMSSVILGNASYKEAKNRWEATIFITQYMKRTKRYPMSKPQKTVSEQDDSEQEGQKN